MNAKISDQLRAELKKHALMRLSEQTGISYPMLHRYRSGKAQPSMERLDVLCDHLKLRLVKGKR